MLRPFTAQAQVRSKLLLLQRRCPPLAQIARVPGVCAAPRAVCEAAAAAERRRAALRSRALSLPAKILLFDLLLCVVLACVCLCCFIDRFGRETDHEPEDSDDDEQRLSQAYGR